MKIIPFQDFVRRFHSGEEFIVFDTETTGLNTYHDNIIEIGAVIWKKDGQLKSFEELIWSHPSKLSAEAQAIHGITPEEIEKARKPKEVYADFIDFCGDRALVAHNIKFDYPMLNSNLIRSGMKPYQNDNVACSLVYAKSQMLPGKLSNLAKHFNIETEDGNLHRALYDVNVLVDVLNRFMKDNEPEEMQYSLII